MAATCSAEARALQVEKEIWRAVDRGEIEITNGIYQQDFKDQPCQACAVGSAARAICGTRSGVDPLCMRQDLKAKGVMSIAESYIMEMGFEFGFWNWSKKLPALQLTRNFFKTKYGEEMPEDSEENPFFKLGQRLRARQRPAP